MRKSSIILPVFICLSILSACGDSQRTITRAEKEAKKRILQIEHELIPLIQYDVIKPCNFHQETLSNGVIEAHNRVDLFWKIQATAIKNIYVQNGQRVKRGEILASLDNTEFLLDMESQQLELRKAWIAFTDRMISNGYSVSDTAIIPRNITQRALENSGYLKARIDSMKNVIELEKYTIRAPFDGIVANLKGKPLQLSSTEMFCTLLDNSILEVRFSILENEIDLIEKGDVASISLFANEKEVYEGEIIDVNPIVNNLGLIDVTAQLAQFPSDWYTGMKVRVRVNRDIPNQIVLPKEAVVMRENRPVVFTVKGNRAHWNYVKIGDENTTDCVILSGISCGDSVIVKGMKNLAHLGLIRMK